MSGVLGFRAPVLVVLALALPLRGREEGARFLLVSSPAARSIFYARLPTLYEQALPGKERRLGSVSVLIDGKASQCKGTSCDEDSDFGLVEPEGLAVFEGGQAHGALLFVADTEADNIYGYHVKHLALDTLSAGSQVKVVRNVVALGVAVDGQGNLYFTTLKGKVLMVRVGEVLDRMGGGKEPKPVELFGGGGGTGTAALAGPVGIVSDDFFVYLANAGGDAKSGVVLKAAKAAAADSAGKPTGSNSSEAAAPRGLQAVASNTDVSEATAVNLCLARDNIFFTGSTESLFAVKVGGGSIAEVWKGFKEPRGCAYDEESTVYVADESADAIFSLPGNFLKLRSYNYTSKAFQVKGPSGVAVLATRSFLIRGRLAVLAA